MKKQDIINQLEMDELDFVKALLSQLQDNANDLSEMADKVNDPESEVNSAFVVFEVKRLAGRTEDIFNLIRQLLFTAGDNVESAIRALNKLEVSDE